MAEIVIQVEGAVVAAFVELVTKLNDTAFRPLFRKLFDWAFTGRP
jgi:U3 small nucleolar RNA-associated protein 10